MELKLNKTNKYFFYVIISLILSSSPLIGQVRINEFMVSNSSTIQDKDGEYSDWIELYNYSSNDINLAGWLLTDDIEDKVKWKFPAITLNAGTYIVVFASGKDIANTNELHTNFKLGLEGEYLALFDPDGNTLTEFNSYPIQSRDVSYSYLDADFIFTSQPTPGSENKFAEGQVLTAPEFNVKHGFFKTPFDLSIISNMNDAEIYYTLDGSEPTELNGKLYSTPIQINKTTIIRAITLKDHLYKSKINTATFIFIDDVITQSNNPPGYPAEWGPYTAMPGFAKADYEMDEEITTSSAYGNKMDESLRSLPVISIVTKKENLFSKSTDPESGGIYIYTGPPGDGDIPELGIDWERPASIEYFNGDSMVDFQEDCGIKIHGGHSRRPEKSPKHSFRITFKEKYGDTKLNYQLFGEDGLKSYNTFILRATYGNSWIHMNASERKHAQLIHDIWGKETQLAMGHPSGRGNFVHLYINGMYWGIYNPTERIDADFAADYLGGQPDEYDIIKDYGEVVEGNKNAWDAMLKLARKGFSSNNNFMLIQGKNPDGTYNPSFPAYLDIENFIDYMILNFYGANWDWDHHNWTAVRNRIQPGKGFKFFSWDAEHIVEDVSSDVLSENNKNCPSELFQLLRKNSEFRKLFADRIQLHCFNKGALTPEKAKERWQKSADILNMPIISESARWGDYRRDVHPLGEPNYLYDKSFWLDELEFMTGEYFPNRTSEFIRQLREADLFPEINAPIILINGNEIAGSMINAGDLLTMSATAGTIYYTLDGTDPCINNSISDKAIKYVASIQLINSVHIKSRALQNSEWSPLNEITLSIPDENKNLKITEIHYHPLAQDSIDEKYFEFIELKNTGEAPFDLSNNTFIEGINYKFPLRTYILPGEFIVLASNEKYFVSRYNFKPFGIYDGYLDNNGERIILAAGEDTIVSVRYNDKSPWPIINNDGYSIVASSPNPIGDQNNANDWKKSLQQHGSPGRDDNSTSVQENISVVSFRLYQNYPNPFNPSTTITYSIPESGNVLLKVYNLLGKEVKTLVNGFKQPGNYSVDFSIDDLSSGVYFYRLEMSKYKSTKKMIIIR